MAFLRSSVDFNLVCIPEALAVNQLEGILTEMRKHGFNVSRLIVNNVVNDPDSAFLQEKAGQQAAYLDIINNKFADLNTTQLPLFSGEVKGLKKLEEAARVLYPKIL
jgi:anion-transporting  ArsA/GET3 family ATPase